MDNSNINTKLTTAAPELMPYSNCSNLQESQQESIIAAPNFSPVVAVSAIQIQKQHHEHQTPSNKRERAQGFNVTSSVPSTTLTTTTTIANTTPTALNLPPPTATPNISIAGSGAADVALLTCLLPAPPPFTTTAANIRTTTTSTPLLIHTSSDPIAPSTLTAALCASDFDSDTELSIVAAVTAANSIATIGDHSTTSPVPSVSTPVQSVLTATAATNGHINNGSNTSTNSSQISLNTKQQRQQKRRRERAQRLQAERDSRCNSSALSGTLIGGGGGGSVGVAVSLGMVTTTAGGGSNGSIIGTATATAAAVLLGSSNNSVLGPGNGMLYHLNSAGSMGEDSNNSNGNFTSSSNGSNNLLPPTDSIASLLLNPPHSPECNSGLMATPSDSEGESLDEDLLSTSSSSTLLLPRDKPPPRPPPPVRRKLPRSPVLEEEIIDGFAILEFKTYEDLEFAIKLGQKRKEKRLSALEELTCTYSIEDMKMPKINDTGQPHPHSHPLRTTNLSSLTVVSNNNLKEVNHHHPPALTIGGAIVVTSNSSSTSNIMSNNNNNSSTTVYTVPLASMCTAPEPDSEAEIPWTGDQYRQQQQQDHINCSAKNKANLSISINSNVNQNEISNCQTHVSPMGLSKHAESSVTSISETVNTISSACIKENGNEDRVADITRPSPLSVDNIVSVPPKDLSSISGSGSTDVNKSQNSTSNANQPNIGVTEYISIKGTRSTDDTVAINSHLNVMLSSSSSPKIKKLNTFEGNQEAGMIASAASAAGLTLEIKDFANGSAQVIETSLLLKKDHDLKESFIDMSDRCSSTNKVTNICDKSQGENKKLENVIAFDFPSTPTHVASISPRQSSSCKTSEYLQAQAIRKESVTGDSDLTFSTALSATEKSPVMNTLTCTNAIGSLTITKKNGSGGSSDSLQDTLGITSTVISTNSITESEDNQQSMSSTDNNLVDVNITHPAVNSISQVTNIGVSVGCDSHRQTSSGIAQDIILGTKMVTSLGTDGVAQRPTNSLLPSTPLTPVTVAQLQGSSLNERASSVLITASVKSMDKLILSNDGGIATSVSVDLQKSTTGSLQMSTTTVANGILTGYPPISGATTAVLSCISPHSGSKVLPIPMNLPPNTSSNPVAAAASGIAKSSFNTGSCPAGATGSSLVFHSGPPPIPHLSAGLPMLIQATPYRTPYTNYSLYTPYNSISHGQYLPSVLPIVAPNTLSSPHRSDTRNSRESPAATSIKAPVTSTTTLQQQNVNGVAGFRPTTPLGYVISSNNAVQSSGTSPTTTTATVSLVNSTSHPQQLSVYTAGAFGVSMTGPVNTTATLSAPAVTSVTVTPQLLSSAPTQMLPQSGYSSHLPQLLTSYPQFAPPAPTHQSALRCSTSSAMGTTNTSVVTVQNLMTAMPTSSLNTPLTAASSVIQKNLSPKSESPSRDRDINYSVTTVRPSNSISMAGGSQGISLGPQFCSLMPSTPISGASVSSSSTLPPATHSVLAVTGPSMTNFSSKTGLWLNPSVMPTSGLTSSVSAGNIRPSPSLLNPGSAGTPSRAIGNAFSPHAVHSSVVSAPVGNFQPTFFATPLTPTLSSSTTPTSNTSISSSSMAILPLVPHTSAVIASMTTATTTTSLVTTAGTTQSTVPTVSSEVTPTPHPFSAESLFQPSKNDQADLLRRELDSRFLDRSGLTQPPPTSSSTYLRQELHHHQHQHTHLHQHQHPQMLSAAPISTANTILPQTPPASSQIFPPPLFKDIPKIPAVDPQFYRGGIGLPPGYTGYSPAGLLHAGLGGPTPFMPPNHLTSFAPKKTGRWNAMHVRIAWEIYYHQNKQSSEKSVCSASILGTSHSSCGINTISGSSGSTGNGVNSASGSAPSAGGIPANNATISIPNGNVVTASGSSSVIGMKSSSALTINTTSTHLLHRSGELSSAATYGRLPFETSPLAASFIGAPPSHIGTSVSPFGRYVGSFGFGGLTHFGREISLSGHLDAWRTSSIPRSVTYHPTGATGPSGWAVKSDPVLENARREAEEREREREIREREQRERDRQRREREERERKEKDEKLKREQQERERERERKERERREIERREIERERLLQQQRINESNKQAAVVVSTPRDRSPHRSIGEHNTEIRIKEEHPRTKEEQEVMLMRVSAAGSVGDPRYHPSSIVAAQANAAVAAAHHHANFMVTGRHGPSHVLPSSAAHLPRNMMPPTLGVGGPLTHFPPSGPPAWGIDPYRDPYAPILRYNPIMEAAFRHEAEERQKVLSIYAAQSAAHLRGKEPSPIPPPSAGPLGLPASHLRMQPPAGVSIIASSPSQPSQTQLPTIGIGKVPGPLPPTMNMAVQHMITVDPLSRSPITTKKETDHTIGIVVSTPGTGVTASVIGIPSASPATSSR
ncbi:mucin-3A isoform X2 [Drosophila innubila]|uniref:mucin-3A isoform X2 n=1 Tax=Drosophila innubila TaxID=198719 RepID=UPI00148E3D1B|nr:mucin-3A isoform X2 [Drosophila innubila]